MTRIKTFYLQVTKTGETKMEQKTRQELSAVKIEQLNKQPIIETAISVSEDRKWVIHKTIVTDIKPVTYLEKVMQNKSFGS